MKRVDFEVYITNNTFLAKEDKTFFLAQYLSLGAKAIYALLQEFPNSLKFSFIVNSCHEKEDEVYKYIYELKQKKFISTTEK